MASFASSARKHAWTKRKTKWGGGCSAGEKNKILGEGEKSLSSEEEKNSLAKEKKVCRPKNKKVCRVKKKKFDDFFLVEKVFFLSFWIKTLLENFGNIW